MDIENAALCKIIETGNLTLAFERHITDAFFDGNESLLVWDLVRDHWKQYGRTPGFDVVHQTYPAWPIYTYPDSLEFYLDKLRDRRLFKVGMTAIREALEEAEKAGPDQGKRLLDRVRMGVSDALSEVPVGKDLDYYTGFFDTVFPELEQRRLSPGLQGLPSGFDSLDLATSGFKPGQLITVVALPKTGKSTLSLFSAKQLRSSGYTSAYFTFEMSAEEQADRLASLVSGIDLNKILSGNLTDAEMAKIKQDHLLRQASHAGLTIVADTSSVTTVSAVQAKIREIKPRMVYIDGAYLMDDENGETAGSPQAITNITRGIKRLAQAEGVPIMITTQGSVFRAKGGVNASTAMYSQSFLQDSDIMIGADKMGRFMKITTPASRSSRAAEFFLEVDWTRGYIGEVPEEDVEIGLAGGTEQPALVKSSGYQDFSVV